jgi:MFS family permease
MGMVPMLVHQWRPALSGLAATASVAVRALPPLLAVLLFLSLASETWRAFGRLEGWRFGALLIGFALLACVILVFGLARERRTLYAIEPGPELEGDARRGPAAPLVARGVHPSTPPLSRLERINVAVALLLSLALRVVAVGAVVGAAFLAVALLVMDRDLTAEWIQVQPDVLASFEVAGDELVLTSASVRVAAALGTFASLYFVAVALGDGRNREEFLDDELARMRRVMAAWAYYRGALRATADASIAGAGDRGRDPLR